MEKQGMSKFAKWLGGIGFAAALGIMLFGLSGAFSPTGAAAETPPNPPARFGGTVKVDGVTPPAGTVVEARIGSTSCGVTSVDSAGRYIIEVAAFDPGAKPNCGTYNDATNTGSVVTFYVGGQLASQTGICKNFQFNPLDLTVVTVTPTVTVTVPAGTTTPTGTATTPGGTGTTAPSTTPRPPVAGQVTSSDDSSMLLVLAIVGIGALAFGVGGTAVARRGR